MLPLLLGISAGGVLGAIARYQLGRVIMGRWGRAFPLGTFIINITGSFFLCFLARLLAAGLHMSAWLYAGLTTGLWGTYTTFSTYAYETAKLLEDGEGLTALAYVLGSVLAGLAAGWLGFLAASGLISVF
jgi:CrcB protein